MQRLSTNRITTIVGTLSTMFLAIGASGILPVNYSDVLLALGAGLGAVNAYYTKGK